MSRPAPRRVPWSSWSEWSAVCRDLHSREGEAQRRGIRRVAAWRGRGSVPLAVNATAMLTELLLRDAELQRNPGGGGGGGGGEVGGPRASS